MKKIRLSIVIFLCAICLPQVYLGNMAGPATPDVGTAITFQKNDSIAVTSEVLNIRVEGAYAQIEATYHMKNMTQEVVTTPSMFVSPNIKDRDTRVVVDGKEADHTAKTYVLGGYVGEDAIETDDWQYAVLYDENAKPDSDGEYAERYQLVDTIAFDMTFQPGESYDVVVSYTYALGGRPTYNYNVKYGEIYYYLKPAAMWKGFESLTVNLYLDEEMPVVERSNLDFKEVGDRHFQYVSDSLPNEDLQITIDESPQQEFWSQFRSPYLLAMLAMCWPLLFLAAPLVLGPIVLVVWGVVMLVKWGIKKAKSEKG